ncbi:MAG: hypothetical protein EHM28_11680, partial [Spirochaetaceae bacterium]
MTRKRIIILLVMCSIIIIGVVVVLQDQQKKLTTQAPVVPKILVDPPPRMIDVPEMPVGAQFAYTGQPKTIPTSFPTYIFTESITTTDLYSLGNTVSSQFGLTGSPSAFVQDNNFTYTKNNTNRTFSVSKTKNVVSVSYERQLVEDTTLKIQDSVQSVSSLFSPFLSLPENEALYPLGTDKTVYDGVVLLEVPTPRVNNYAFGITLDSLPLLTRENTKRWASALVDENGFVRVLNYLVPPSVEMGTAVSVISLGEAVANINARRADILWITQTSGEEYGVVPSFVQGDLTDASLVYVYKGSALVPAYLFEGSGKATTGEEQIFE